MAEFNFAVGLQEALTKAFACNNQEGRLAYLRLAEFYETQATRQAVRQNRQPIQIFR